MALYASFDITLVALNLNGANVSWQAHLGGALAGLFVGILVLQNRKVDYWEKNLKLVCMVAFGIFIVVCVGINIFGNCKLKCINEPTYGPDGKNCIWPL